MWWRVEGTTCITWIQGHPKRILYERLLGVTWIWFFKVAFPNIIGKVIKQSDCFPTLSNPRIDNELSWILDLSTPSIPNRLTLHMLRVEPLSTRVIFIPQQSYLAIIMNESFLFHIFKEVTHVDER